MSDPAKFLLTKGPGIIQNLQQINDDLLHGYRRDQARILELEAENAALRAQRDGFVNALLDDKHPEKSGEYMRGVAVELEARAWGKLATVIRALADALDAIAEAGREQK